MILSTSVDDISKNLLASQLECAVAQPFQAAEPRANEQYPLQHLLHSLKFTLYLNLIQFNWEKRENVLIQVNNCLMTHILHTKYIVLKCQEYQATPGSF